MKRIYGTIAAIALVSGITGAFAYSFAAKALHENTSVTDPTSAEQNSGIMQLTADSSTPAQPVDLTVAAEKASDAVVYIKVTIGGKTQTVEYYDPFEDFFGDFFGRGNGNRQRQQQQVQTPKRQASGSGVIISADGYIVTNNHVVENAESITITLNDNREFTARVIGLDQSTDLALLKVDGTNLPSIIIGDSDKLKVGEWVLAIGNPFNLTSTVTAGIVSAKARGLGANKNGIESFIQTDAAINAGNSGGALVNARGELVGINAMLYSQTGSFTGYGFAIPVTIMQKVVNDLKEYGTVQRALIGISGTDLHNYIDSQKQKDEKYSPDFGTNDGIYVAEVPEDGAAKAAGIKEGDVIISLDGKKMSKMSELQENLIQHRPGDKVQVGLMRDKKEKMVEVTLRNSSNTTKVIKSESLAALGGEFEELTDKQKESLNVAYGVQIKKITGGYLQQSGVEKDFIIRKVNGQNIKSVSDLESAFKAAQNSEERTLFIWGQYPSGKTQSLSIMLSE